MLREHSDIDRHSRWPDVKKRIESDARYRAVENSILREDYFHDHCKILKNEKRKQKDKDRERKERKEREKRDKDKHRDKSKSSKEHKDKDKRRKSKDDDLSKSRDSESSRKDTERDDQVRRIEINIHSLLTSNLLLPPIGGW